MNAEEEELEEVLAATLSSGTAYYASTSGSSSFSPDIAYPRPTFSNVGSSGNDGNTTISDTPQVYSSLSEGSSINHTTSPISASPASSDHDVVSHPDSIVRITKPLKSRFSNVVRIIKPLPKQSLKSRLLGAIRVIKPPKRISKTPSLSVPETQLSSNSMDVDNQTPFPNQVGIVEQIMSYTGFLQNLLARHRCNHGISTKLSSRSR